MRTYSEREVADIIERAAERQATADRTDDRPGLTLDEIERIGAEAGLDPAALRAAANEADTILLVTPEHNGTVPASLKNAIDWLSRPFGAGALAGKPTAVVGTAFGQYGGVWAQDEARKAAGIAGAQILEDVKLAVPGSMVRFAEVHPKDDAEVSGLVTGVLLALTGAATPVAA